MTTQATTPDELLCPSCRRPFQGWLVGESWLDALGLSEDDNPGEEPENPLLNQEVYVCEREDCSTPLREWGREEITNGGND